MSPCTAWFRISRARDLLAQAPGEAVRHPPTACPSTGAPAAGASGAVARRGLAEPLLAELNRQLDAKGLAPVERSFATMKRWYGDGRVRYRSLVRNGLQLQLLALAMNLRRALVLSA